MKKLVSRQAWHEKIRHPDAVDLTGLSEALKLFKWNIAINPDAVDRISSETGATPIFSGALLKAAHKAVKRKKKEPSSRLNFNYQGVELQLTGHPIFTTESRYYEAITITLNESRGGAQ